MPAPSTSSITSAKRAGSIRLISNSSRTQSMLTTPTRQQRLLARFYLGKRLCYWAPEDLEHLLFGWRVVGVAVRLGFDQVALSGGVPDGNETGDGAVEQQHDRDHQPAQY